MSVIYGRIQLVEIHSCAPPTCLSRFLLLNPFGIPSKKCLQLRHIGGSGRYGMLFEPQNSASCISSKFTHAYSLQVC